MLLAMSDNGPQMRSHTTREFMAACAIMQRFGRPRTPTDQAWIEIAVRPRQGRVAAPGEDPRPRRTRRRTRPRPGRIQHRPAARRHRLRHPRRRTPRPRRAIRQARRDGLAEHARPHRHTVEPARGTHHDRAPSLAGYFPARCLKDSDTPPCLVRRAAHRGRTPIAAHLPVSGNHIHPFPRVLQWNPLRGDR